ncbi:MAG: endolytic transglycosylase MltG [Bacteroidales bacterium]|nr:endolytic transglycosylase MltG [Bacteroidales bacterium]
MKKKYIIIAAAALLLFLVGVAGLLVMRHQQTVNSQPVRVNVPTNSSFSQLLDSLQSQGCITPSTKASFSTMSRLRGLTSHVKPGSYKIQPGMPLFRVVQKFYSGSQDPVRVTINKHRTLQQFCQFIGSKLEMDADTLLAYLLDTATLQQYQSTPATIICLFPQNTYEFYWNIDPTTFVSRMQRESDRFWTDRQTQLAALGLTRQQVLTIASIVEEETNCHDEKPDIASVYLNRYRVGMPLQADPTVKFALGDFSIRRVWGSMLQTDNPYNTYRYAGLPPGPICIPSAKSIDAVLKNKKTDYFFFCAKEDFSGRHNFSSSISQHLSNANKFHKALNERKIK